MQISSALITIVLISNAVIFVALTFFRRERPELRTRLFSWALHNGTHRQHHHSSFPA